MSSDPKDLATTESLFGFFYDRVHSARRNQRVPLSDETEFYLVNLLVGFLRSAKLFRPEGTQVDRVPLAIRLGQAQHLSREERYRQLKHVGDYTLYMTGFFAESLRRGLVDLDYYIALGGSAYGSISRGTGRRGDVSEDLFGELSEKFARCAGVLAEVSDGARGSTSRDVLALYEAWLSHQSESARRRLEELGVTLPGPGRAGRSKESVH